MRGQGADGHAGIAGGGGGEVIQPVALGERIVALQASLARLVRLLRSAAPDPAERQRALAEAEMVLRQHEDFEFVQRR